MVVLFCAAATASGPEPVPELPPLSPAARAWRAELQTWLEGRGAAPLDAATHAAAMVAFEEGVAWRTGEVVVADGAVALALGEGDRYADPEATATILEAWGNPPDPDTLGMWLPAGSHLFGPGSWAVLLTLQGDGWVDDADAAAIDADALLASMQQVERDGAVERRAQGFDGLELVGWAAPPRYDVDARALYWATAIRSDAGNETLNYDVRVLGRRGVLSLDALSALEDLPRVAEGMERIRTRATFREGHRHEDYAPGVDPKAAYGIAALIAGGAVAAKTGLLQGAVAALLASKKLLVAAAVGAVGAVRAAWRRWSARPPAP